MKPALDEQVHQIAPEIETVETETTENAENSATTTPAETEPNGAFPNPDFDPAERESKTPPEVESKEFERIRRSCDESDIHTIFITSKSLMKSLVAENFRSIEEVNAFESQFHAQTYAFSFTFWKMNLISMMKRFRRQWLLIL